MKVLIAASESYPFIKTGGLGDVVGALPKSLKKEGVDVRVIMPKYKDIRQDLKMELNFVKWFMVRLSWRNQYCGVFEYTMDGVKYYFIDNEYYFNRDGLYGYYDDGERFAYFDRAVLEVLKEINWKPDVIHCNDWHTGMIPVMLKVEYKKDDFYKNIKTVFSIHNILYQGVFDPKVLPDIFGYDMRLFNDGSLEFYGGMSFMKGALNYSDRISTVSNSYAEEIKTPQYGERLDGILRDKKDNLKGILNGIDYSEYNPTLDKYIFKKYSLETFEEKKKNKVKLQRELGLTLNRDVPVIGMVSRLTAQKGVDLIMDVVDRILQYDVQLVILGTGDKYYEDQFINLQRRYKNKVSVNIKFDNALSHRIYAGSDMFFMPSLFEPCGLGQMIALKYGTIPIVRETGGLKDTIRSYNEYENKGNGFSFKGYSSNELLIMTEYALKLFKNKDIWMNIVKEAMNDDNSWTKSAKEYKELYKSVMES